jgi:hypothetical protein
MSSGYELDLSLTHGECALAWSRYRMLARRRAWMFVLFFPLAGFASYVANTWSLPHVAEVLLVMYFVPFTAVGWTCDAFRCPRCGDRFFGPAFSRVNGFRQRCYWCGLWKWDCSDVGAPRSRWRC